MAFPNLEQVGAHCQHSTQKCSLANNEQIDVDVVLWKFLDKKRIDSQTSNQITTRTHRGISCSSLIIDYLSIINGSHWSQGTSTFLPFITFLDEFLGKNKNRCVTWVKTFVYLLIILWDSSEVIVGTPCLPLLQHIISNYRSILAPDNVF